MALYEALGSSLDLELVLSRAYPLLTNLIAADCGAVGVSASGLPQDYRWLVSELPSHFFAAYPQMAEHDFVRRAVLARPNQVLRDSEMLARPELEANGMYRHAREIGVPLEQVMAVMLHVESAWQSGISLYRERRRPFTEKERSLLQALTPALANAVRNCHQFGALARASGALDAALTHAPAPALIADSEGRELVRSAAATKILEQWFAAHECRTGALPDALRDELRGLRAAPLSSRASWQRSNASSTLEVEFIPISSALVERGWLLLLRERLQALALPASWNPRLTPSEREVVAAVLQGWDNRLIAQELGRAIGTIKKHLQRSFEKLGLESRSALIARAAELQGDKHA